MRLQWEEDREGYIKERFMYKNLENGDEQAAAIRRELDSRRQFCDKVMRDRLFPKFLVPDGKSQLEWNKIYVEEQRQAVNVLMQNLESMPVTKRLENTNYGARALQNMSGVVKPLSRIDKVSDADDSSLTKSDISLMFTIELVVQEVTNIKNADAKRKVYCTMEMEGGEKMATNAVPSTAAKWDCQADFRSNQIRPCLKVKLFQKSKNMLAIEDKELGRVLIKPLPNTPTCTEWYTMYTGQKNKSEADYARIRLGIRIDKPANLKHCGYLYAQGKQAWKKWKMRFFALVQVSQYTFAMCSFQERKTEPHEMVQLDGFTVDYSLPESGLEGGTVFFNAMKESDSIIFSCSDDEDRNLWVQAIYRATGQSYKPQIPSNNTPKLRPTSIEAISTANIAPANNSSSSKTLPKHPYLEEFLQIDPTNCDQTFLFEDLLRETLRHRLNDQYACLGWLSPGQLFLMDEYCARYGVRGVIRQILYLNELLDHAEKGSMIDPTLLHFCYAYVSSHNYGNSPEGYQTVTVNEMAQFYSVRERLQSYLESQLANIRYSFPFGRPEGALKATLSLLERVLMNDLSTPVPMEEIKGIVTINLDKAAKLNFAQVQQESRLEDYDVILSTPEKRLDELVHLAELCIEVHQQNEEYHSEGREAFPWFPAAMRDHNELFWFQFSVEMDLILEAQPSDCWDSFPLFQLLNDFFASSGHVLFKGRFHKHLMDVYAPMVIRYIDLMETSIAQAVYRGLENETWRPCQYGSQTTDDVLWKLDALQTFIFDLHWPEDVFATHLQSRLKVMANDMIYSIINNILLLMNVFAVFIGFEVLSQPHLKMVFGRRKSAPKAPKPEELEGRRFSLIDRMKDLSRGIIRRGSTSNAKGSDLEYDPEVRRRFSVQVSNPNDKRLHTSQAHMTFKGFDWDAPLNPELDENDNRNDPSYRKKATNELERVGSASQIEIRTPTDYQISKKFSSSFSDLRDLDTISLNSYSETFATYATQIAA
ncbi:unnamed protein product [Oikopleura dioica]|uniref:PH domain-containing protein n=2 Tax=Oikopleura dioica TaxID=34765 RepID=E4XSH1_OIKDI|nr:unnamed protein product [Oikopleura dioica]